MALIFGGKRKPGGTGPTVPLDPLEQSLTERLAAMMRASKKQVSEADIARAINELDPMLMEQTLVGMTVSVVGNFIEGLLRGLFSSKGEKEAIRMIGSGQGGAPIYVDSGIRLPSGIILPDSLAPAEMTGFTMTPLQRMTLNYIDPKAVEYARTRSAQLVTDIDHSNRMAMRRLIGEHMTEGRSVDELARSIRQTTGLHTRWARAVDKFDQDTVRSLVKSGMNPQAARDKADVLTGRYRDRLIRRRAEMIARTEVQMAQNMARLSAWDASVKTGVTDPASMKVWSTAPLSSQRGRPCDICLEQKARGPIQWNAAFPMGVTMPPAHPHCRCTAVLVPPSRGLTGLPSQDIGSYVSRLDHFYAEQEASL